MRSYPSKSLFTAAGAVAAICFLSGPASAQTCPITGSLDATDSFQIGREARNSPVLACPSAMSKQFPGFADTTNPHLYDIYHFTNPGAAACFTLLCQVV